MKTKACMIKHFLVIVIFFVLWGMPSFARTYTHNEITSGTVTININSADDGTKFRVGGDTTKYDDLGDITVSGGTLNIHINTPNIIWLSGKLSVTGSGTLNITQLSSITSDSIIKRKSGNTGALISVDGTNAKLIVKGKGTDNRIVFHGNGKFIMPTGKAIKNYGEVSLTGDDDGMVKAEDAIINAKGGTIDLKYVDLKYNYNNINDGNGTNTSKTAGGINICVRSINKIVTLTMDHCDIVGCMAKIRGAALFYDDSNSRETGDSSVTMTDCDVSDCYCYGYEGNVGGQIIRAIGSSTCSIHLLRCKIHDNLSNKGTCVGISATAAKVPCEFISCDVYSNRSPQSYAVSVTANAIIQDCLIHDNYGSGGGISLSSYSGTTLPTFKPYDMNTSMDEKTKIYNNEAVSGTGGMLVSIRGETGIGKEGIWTYKEDGTPISINVTINGAQVYNNTSISGPAGITVLKNDDAPDEYITKVDILSGIIRENKTQTGKGGGFLITGTIPVTIGQVGKDLIVYGNEAESGGGFYIDKGANVVINECTIGTKNSKNKALNGNGGGMFVRSGDVTINGGSFINNQAIGSGSNGNGGGLYVSGGNVTFIRGDFLNNKADNCGGGLYISGGDFSFTRGSIEENSAYNNGGGVYMSGGDVEFNKPIIGSSIEPDASISSNTAKNGGGLYLASGAKMKFLGGRIINNQADTTLTTSVTRAKTAYHGGAGVPEWGGSVIEGCGGGIYLQNGTSSKKTTLTFKLDPDDKTFGLYTNRAQKAGDDLVAEGQYTEVVLPSVREMQLYGFEGKDATPFWYQDYFEGDPGYRDNPGDGRAVTNAVNYIGRFREMLNLFTNEYYNHRIADDAANLDRIKDFYLCLTLSYNMLDITISAKYLLSHETALFQLVRHGGTEDYKYDVLLRGDKTDSTTGLSSRTLRNMPWGTYSIFPNDAWNWAYDKIAPQQNLRLGETGNYEFVFEMNHINGAQVPQHDERQPVKPSGNQ